MLGWWGAVFLTAWTSTPPDAPSRIESDALSGEELDPDRLEFGLLPAISYNSDLGVGALATLARFRRNANPFDWRLELLTFFSLRDQGEGIEVSQQSHSARLDKPGLWGGRLRLEASLGYFEQANTGYYGLGSAAPSPPENTRAQLTQVRRITPEASVNLRFRLWSRPVPVGKRRLELLVGTRVRYNSFEAPEGSRFALDQAQARTGGELARLFRGSEDHVLWLLVTGLLFDTRDREFDSRSGGFHELSLRVSPGVDESLEYAGLAGIGRWFLSFGHDRPTLASQTVVDALFGDVPIAALSAFGGQRPLQGPGGGLSLRGVPLQRFYGKLKLMQSLELRARLFPFRLGGQRFLVGALAFVDAGRVWGDYENRSIEVLLADGGADRRRLDGGLGDFELGLGGGLRLKWGETFIIRADLGHTPTLGETGFYIDIGDTF
ncbi:MAG: BamA/TamA family outer membrane protein [Myxococcota bacterium]